MVDTTWTADDLARIETAIASGRKRVRYEGKGEVEYHDLAQMLKVRDAIRGALATQPSSAVIYAGRISTDC